MGSSAAGPRRPFPCGRSLASVMGSWSHLNPRPVLAFGYCHRPCLCNCQWVCINHLLARTITHQPFKLESPNSKNGCKTPWLRCLFGQETFPARAPHFGELNIEQAQLGRPVRHTASCGFMVDPCGAPWWPLRCNGLDALSAPYVYVVISPNMPSHIPTEWDPLHTKHSICLQSLGPSE